MPDNKLTDNEIIKALECCTTNGASCKDCPAFVKVDRSNCKKYFRGALDLINRLQAENERLRKECGNQSNLWSNHYEGLYQTALGTIKPKAYKEFAERLKKEKHICLPPIGYPIDENDWVIYEDDIDNILKELVGEDK